MSRLKIYGILIVTILWLASGCQPSADAVVQHGKTTVHSVYGGQPNLVAHADELILSWVEYLDDTTDVLMLSYLQDESWSMAQEISRGSDWFVNWADFPSVVGFPDGKSLAAHWLQKSAEGTYDYDVRISISKDEGRTWAPSFVPHTDGIPAEHGFVSMIPVDSNRVLATWLDGRYMKEEEGEGHGHDHGGGPMTLRAAEFDVDGNLYAEAELDDMVCECCQTDASMTALGPVVVYRDRSESEIRDISIVRRVQGVWTQPQAIHSDLWEIAGCPVNGPAVAANGNNVAVAWFTAPEGDAQVNVAWSLDGGATFNDPVRVDNGKPIGRVDIVSVSDGVMLVSWVENTGEEGSVYTRTITHEGELSEMMEQKKTSTSRRSGFPVLESSGDFLWLAMTSIHADSTGVETFSLRNANIFDQAE